MALDYVSLLNGPRFIRFCAEMLSVWGVPQGQETLMEHGIVSLGKIRVCFYSIL